jgi:hypothetical protein
MAGISDFLHSCRLYAFGFEKSETLLEDGVSPFSHLKLIFFLVAHQSHPFRKGG